MIKIKRFNSTDADFNSNIEKLLAFESAQDDAVDATVAKILADIKIRKNIALIEYTNQFDRLSATSGQELELTQDHLQQSLTSLPAIQRNALEQAAERVRSYHEKQQLHSWQYTDSDGTLLGQKITPLDRVGLYVPGGKASYPSSVLMNAIPAKVAGVQELIMVVPTPDGERNDMVLAAAAISKVDRVFTIGGAQAIGALAYGTETIPQVDKIVGPGNAYVAAAKRRVFGIVGIDMVAGPSEILVICDGKTDPDWIAMDLFSQAEHDELAQAILLSPDANFLDQVAHSINRLLSDMPRKAVIQASLEHRGALIQVQRSG
jgi:histidinol dehydrogenase